MKKLTLLLFFTLLFICSGIYAQKDSSHKSTGNIYQDLSKNFDIKDAKFIVIMKKNHVLIDTAMLNKIDPNWLEKVNILTSDPNQRSSKISTIEIYIMKKHIRKTKKVINKK